MVQDYAANVEAGKAALPADLAPRFEFMPHDFFAAQPVKAKDDEEKIVYFLRLIMHDWSDKYCIQILRRLVAVMKAGSTILVNDSVLPPMGTANRFLERLGRCVFLSLPSFPFSSSISLSLHSFNFFSFLPPLYYALVCKDPTKKNKHEWKWIPIYG